MYNWKTTFIKNFTFYREGIKTKKEFIKKENNERNLIRTIRDKDLLESKSSKYRLFINVVIPVVFLIDLTP